MTEPNILKIKRFVLRNKSPRWFIFLIDLAICYTSVILAVNILFSFAIPAEMQQTVNIAVISILSVRIISFFINKTYAGIIRYTSAEDVQRILLVIASGSLLLILINVVNVYVLNGNNVVPYRVVLIDFITTVYALTTFRLLVKSVFYDLFNITRGNKNVIIYGTDELSMLTHRAIILARNSRYKIVAFVDDDKKNENKMIEGIRIFHIDKMRSIIDKFEVKAIILAKQNISPLQKSEIADICLNSDVKILVAPSKNWIKDGLNIDQIKDVQIEDLLEREPIQLSTKILSEELNDKVVMITGAAGSIGSEIVRQITRFNPKKIILFDQAETPLYELELILLEEIKFKNFEIVIGDITNSRNVEATFKHYRPSIVYHAAAYKHVPLMEKHPVEAIHNNVFGTKTLADYSMKYGVRKFVMISTDKAVNPTNIMGATKRIAEIYIQSLNNRSDTFFITTRFGNVLGSNGSVIPRFRKQIESGGPVTVTHPEVRRFFMTIPEACQLVLEASVMGEGGQIYIFDMGKSIKVDNLARKMIQLSGLREGMDINIKYTGLRPGEKLYEELFNDSENDIPTHHPKIMIARVLAHDYNKVNEKIEMFKSYLADHDSEQVISVIKEIVPEYKAEKNTPLEMSLNN